MIRKIIENFEKMIEKSRWKRLKILTKAIDGFFYETSEKTSLPHFVDYIDIKRYMTFVIISLLPSTIASIYFYGWRVLFLIFVSYIFGGICEVIFAIVRKREIEEGFLVTGLIFPLTLPPTVPWWVVAVGICFGVIFGKEVFGGTGKNIFNPALVGRVFITISFPKIMSMEWYQPIIYGGFLKFKPDAITSATPLISFKSNNIITPIKDLIFGFVPGCIGETFRIGIILGGIFLLITKIANWRIPLTYLLSSFFISFIGNIYNPEKFAPPLFQIFSGGLLFGAFFMATDPVTTPFTNEGKYIAGILLGLLTIFIRSFSGYVEGVMFSILFMNGISPLIDYIVLEKKYKIKYGMKNERIL